MLVIYVISIILEFVNVFCEYNDNIINLYDYGNHPVGMPSLSKPEQELEVQVEHPRAIITEEPPIIKEINCDNFSKYVLNCTMEAALFYNSDRKAPPLPARMPDWCKAIRHLTQCGVDWNEECRDLTDSHFNTESLRGHMHIVSNICEDPGFLTEYDGIPSCIEGVANGWEDCYISFKMNIEDKKNTTHEWTHFATHFLMCCARAHFRRCTFNMLFDESSSCTRDQAVVLQKFSVIVSEGDVFQDCDTNMMYSTCPGGDPRPSQKVIKSLIDYDDDLDVVSSAPNVSWFSPGLQLVLLIVYLICNIRLN